MGGRREIEKEMKRLSLLLLAVVLTVTQALAIPADPTPARVSQPDGSVLTVRLIGDEFYHYTTTTDGYTILLNEQGAYVYAAMNGSILEPTAIMAHDPAERGAAEQSLLAVTPRYLTSPVQVQRAQAQHVQRMADKPAFEFSNLRGLVVLINFTDVTFQQSNPQAFYTSMLNDENYSGYTDSDGNHVSCPGSMKTYFSDQSSGAFAPTFDVCGPVSVNFASTECNRRARTIFVNALRQLESQIDFTQYDSNNDGKIDMVYFLVAGLSSSFSGNNSGYLWPHASTLYGSFDGKTADRYACSTEIYGWESTPSSLTIEGIGTMCHEFTHVLGLPDLYDTDYSGSGGESHHPGEWDLMAGGGSFNYGRSPVGYSLYERYTLGWSQPQVITAPGDYTLQPLNTTQQGYILRTSVANEYFFLENRQKTGWDTYLPGHGMLVTRMDSTNAAVWVQNKGNCNPDHMYYEILRAGNSTSGARPSDPFPGTAGNVTLTNNTTPNLLTWSGKENSFVINAITETAGVINFKVLLDGEVQTLVEDFETMTANTKTGEKGVQGRWAEWDFTKAGVRAPGEGKCNGVNSVLMKKPSQFATVTPVYYNTYQVTTTIYNTTSTASKYTLEYSIDKGATWTKVKASNGSDGVEVPAKTSVAATWPIMLGNTQAVLYRVTQVGGSASAATYADDFTIYYTGAEGGYVAVSALTLDPAEASLEPEETLAINATLTPSDATYPTLAWVSSNPAVATVSADGVVTAVSAGTAVITASAIDDETVAATCQITVKGSETTGDVNGDGQVTIADANVIISIILNGTDSVDEATLAAADVNGDGQVTIADANVVIAAILAN